MKLFKITGVFIKAFCKLKMAENAVLLQTLAKLRLKNWPRLVHQKMTTEFMQTVNFID